MRFDFTDLNLFRHIVEAGSITHGAARANLALAAASTRIRKMEMAFGTELLVRGRQGVVPTQAGRTLLQHARGILAQSERLQEDLTPYARGLAGQVRVLSNSWGGGGFSQTLLDEINRANSAEMLFVAAAGNDGRNTDIIPSYPAGYSAPNIIAVAIAKNVPDVKVMATDTNEVSQTSMVRGASKCILSTCWYRAFWMALLTNATTCLVSSEDVTLRATMFKTCRRLTRCSEVHLRCVIVSTATSAIAHPIADKSAFTEKR